jgi:hypothetical protein
MMKYEIVMRISSWITRFFVVRVGGGDGDTAGHC